MHKAWLLGLFANAAMAGCATTNAPEAMSGPASIAPRAETAPTQQSDANNAVLIPRADGSGLIVGSSETAGIELYGLDGVRLAQIAAGAAVGVDARYNEASQNWTLAALDGAANRLRLFELDANTNTARERTAGEINIGFAGESLCLYRDARDGTLYAFALGGAGEVTQFMISTSANGAMSATLVRHLRVASEASYCTTDDASGDLYVAEQGVGFWRFDADPEAEVVPELIDAARIGNVTEEAGGVAVYDAGAASYLVASDASANRFHLYDRNNDHAYVGSFTLGAGAASDGVEAAGGLYATSFAYPGFPQGALVAMDDENDGGTNYKLVSWADIASAMNLAAGAAVDPRVAPESAIAIVHPTVETTPVETDGDSADDPAIWVNPADPSRSIIIGTQKQSGLYVYDLQGRVLQFLPDGRMNNVDVRDGFRLGADTVSLVTASNRTTDGIAIYRVDPLTRRLVDVANGLQPTGFIDPYGLCMYRSTQSGQTYVFINGDDGDLRQYRLSDAGNGRVDATPVRDIPFATQTEGCVADDEHGILYIAEEDVGLWRISAEPDGGSTPTSFATVEGNDALKDDLEGIGLYDLGDGRGYLVVSSQGNNTYAVFRREGANEYVGSFAVLADPARGIDGISETDGLEVLSANLGGDFASGIFVAQDGRNISPPEYQNFKLVPWSAIADALGLESRQ